MSNINRKPFKRPDFDFVSMEVYVIKFSHVLGQTTNIKKKIIEVFNKRNTNKKLT